MYFPAILLSKRWMGEDGRQHCRVGALINLALFFHLMASALGFGPDDASARQPVLKRSAATLCASGEDADALRPHKRPHVAGPYTEGANDEGDEGPEHESVNGAFSESLGSFNDRMHPRNRYSGRRPDFAALAARFADFAALSSTDSSGRVHVDWKNPAASVALTRALLRDDFGLQWDLPRGFLCPPVPQRANYVHWIEDLLAGSTEVAIKPAGDVCIPTTAKGVDIGVGASAIYPLLALSLHPGWKMIGTDISEAALDSARANIERNHLIQNVDLRLVTKEGSVLVDALKDSDGILDFCMCNPPFFRASEEARKGADYRACEATLEELVTPGGETAFINRIITDSKVLGARIRWYTTMLGHKSSLPGALAAIKACGASAIRSSALYQGHTIRWVVAWSYAVPEVRVASGRFIALEPPQRLMAKIDAAQARFGGFAIRWPPELAHFSVADSLSSVSAGRGEVSGGGVLPEAVWSHRVSGGLARRGSGPHCCMVPDWVHKGPVNGKLVARGQVFRESWTRRARRAGAVPGRDDGAGGSVVCTTDTGVPLFEFALLLLRPGLPVVGQPDCLAAEGHEWSATVMLDQDRGMVSSENCRLFDSFASMLLRQFTS